MLPPFRVLLFPPLVLAEDCPGAVELSAGLEKDLADLVTRLGGLRLRTGLREPDAVEAARGPRLTSYDAESLHRLLEDEPSHGVVLGRLSGAVEGPLRLGLALRDLDGVVRWSGEAELADGSICRGRLHLAGQLVEAATDLRKDYGRLAGGATDSVAAYRAACQGRSGRGAPLRRAGLLERALVLDPGYLDASLALADVFEELGDPGRALELLGRAARRFEDQCRVRLRYGLALRDAGQPVEATAHVQASLELEPDGVTIFHAGLFAEVQGDREVAQLLYERAMERGCVHPSLCNRLARLRLEADRPAEAVELWERTLELDFRMDGVLSDLALAYHRTGDDEKAEALFGVAVRRQPESFATHATYATFLAERARPLEAVAASSRALRIKPSSARMLVARGEARLALQDRTGARRDLAQALDRGADEETVRGIRSTLARMARAGGRAASDQAVAQAVELLSESPEASLSLLAEAVDLDPGNWKAQLVRALVHREREEWTEAKAALRQVLRHQPGHTGATGELSLVLLAQGQLAEAESWARRAVALAPRDPAVVCNLGLVLMEAGELEAAEEVLVTAWELDPEDPITKRCREDLKQRKRRAPAWGENWGAGSEG